MLTQPLKQQRPLLGQSRSRTPEANYSHQNFFMSTVPKKLDHFKQTKSEFRFNQRSSFLKQLT